MDPRQILRDYIATQGTYADAASALGCSRIMIQKVLGGRRGVGKGMAHQWADKSGGALKFGDMVRIEATAPDGKQVPKAKAAKRKPRKARARGRK